MTIRVIHKKTGLVYEMIGPVIDCTNARDGTAMIAYTDGVRMFVREAVEFFEKFALDKGDPDPDPDPDTDTDIDAEWPDALEDPA